MNYPWIQIADGSDFEPYHCTKDDISIEVIAAALSKLCRFSGHTKRFYSVAEHSIHVSNLLPAELKLAGLLHDAHEALTGFGDVVNPMKTLDLKMLEKSIDFQIALHFGIDHNLFYHELVKEADLRMLHTEKVFIMKKCARDWNIEMPGPIDLDLMKLQGSPETAEWNFLNHFNKLTGATYLTTELTKD